MTVQIQEQFSHNESCTFIAVYKRMVLRNPKGISSGETSNIYFRIIYHHILRPCPTRLETSSVPNAHGAAMLCELFAMQGQNHICSDPDIGHHFANS